MGLAWILPAYGVVTSVRDVKTEKLSVAEGAAPPLPVRAGLPVFVNVAVSTFRAAFADTRVNPPVMLPTLAETLLAGLAVTVTTTLSAVAASVFAFVNVAEMVSGAVVSLGDVPTVPVTFDVWTSGGPDAAKAGADAANTMTGAAHAA